MCTNQFNTRYLKAQIASILFLVLVLSIALESLAQNSKNTIIEKELVFENTKPLKIAIGDNVEIQLKRLDKTIAAKILSIGETSLVIGFPSEPYKLTVPIQNISSLRVVGRNVLNDVFTTIAQNNNDTTKLYHIETKDGNEYIGTIMFQDQMKIQIKTEKLGLLTINKTDIVEINMIDTTRLISGNYWFENPQSTRYLWSPNGYGIKAGEGYYQNVWVLVSQFSIGVTDNFSIGFGLVPLFLFGGAPTPMWIAPKFSIPVVKDKFNLGIGALAGTVTNEEKSGFGIAYGTTTFGSRDRNLSLGLGYGYSGGGWAKAPTFSFSSLIRTGSRGYFITENYYLSSATNYTILMSLGGRRIIKKSGIDFGLVFPFTKSMPTFVAIPWLGITVPLGNNARVK